MCHIEILLDDNGCAISPCVIRASIKDKFWGSYNDAVKEIICKSKVLDKDGVKFIDCAWRILKSFGMTRSGPFYGNCCETLSNCWDVIGADLIEINNTVLNSGLSRDRYLLELSDQERKGLIAEIWIITKKLLPFTMGETTYGLVGASKILFSVLPEIVLPIDNVEWLYVFQTVDLGDVLHRMVFDIQKWEEITGKKFNDLDCSKRLTTLPSVYNVMAMEARSKAKIAKDRRLQLGATDSASRRLDAGRCAEEKDPGRL
jgi:hypothetical protein